ncbi:hypothetical protein SASPL_113048 [Salvia splendens]|uniref:Protein kinase domain-containing protein n=1 Tax=Salvia splendens TaxID=180675 RepID=A0A8X8Y3W2_SALSN|nr:hypothetical protein SASPL_113048 [Salvia splendens]
MKLVRNMKIVATQTLRFENGNSKLQQRFQTLPFRFPWKEGCSQIQGTLRDHNQETKHLAAECNKRRRFQETKGAFPECVSVEEYESLGKISSGSYGVVYKVQHKKTGEIMAMKEEFSGLSPSTRAEIDILKSLGHPSIVQFKEVALDEYDGVYVVMEYLDTDLRRYMSLKGEDCLAMSHVKKLMKQLIQGVTFFIGTRSCIGISSPRMAPELLLGERRGSCAVDMWAVGCIFAEMVLNEVLFRGGSEEDQLHEMYCILGHPSAKNVESSICGANLMLSRDGFDLLKGLLCYDPVKRMTAEMALNHVWFEDEITS